VDMSHGTFGQLGSQLTSNDRVAHTISQRLRTLKKIPPELIPLGERPSQVHGSIYRLTIVSYRRRHWVRSSAYPFRSQLYQVAH
jgi:hypothetical protein